MIYWYDYLQKYARKQHKPFSHLRIPRGEPRVELVSAALSHRVAQFNDLPFLAVESFPEGQVEWDGDEPSQSPLRPKTLWPRGREPRTRFYPRRTEGEEGRPHPAEPEPRQESGASTGTNNQDRTDPPAPDAAESAESVLAEEGRTSAFRRLGPSARHPPTRPPSPDRFLDPRRGPTNGVLFGNIHPLPYDSQDAPRQSCFNCWQSGHTWFVCRELRRLFCCSCRRRRTTLRTCPRCGDVHLQHLR